MGSTVKINIRFAPRRTGDLSEYFADVNLANKILNWRSKKSISSMCKDVWIYSKTSNEEF